MSSAYPQALHFFYGLGALLSPVISEPFLRNACEGGHFESNIFGWTLENSSMANELLTDLERHAINLTHIINVTSTPMTRVNQQHSKPFVQYAYWLVALLQVLFLNYLLVVLLQVLSLNYWGYRCMMVEF